MVNSSGSFVRYVGSIDHGKNTGINFAVAGLRPSPKLVEFVSELIAGRLDYDLRAVKIGRWQRSPSRRCRPRRIDGGSSV
jgi:hypothetical protein